MVGPVQKGNTVFTCSLFQEDVSLWFLADDVGDHCEMTTIRMRESGIMDDEVRSKSRKDEEERAQTRRSGCKPK